MQIKLIALDLDGTLLNDDKLVSERNRNALQRAADAGVWIVPSTGRFYDGMPSVVRELPYIRYAITINGAQVFDMQKKKTLYRAEISPQEADRLFAYMDTLPVIYDCYQNGWGWMDQRHYDRIEAFLEDRFELDMAYSLRTPVVDLRQTMRRRNQPIQKSQMFFRDLERRRQELARLPKLFPNLAVSTAIYNNIEINSRDANKGRALQELCKALGVDISQAMAF